MPKKKPWVGEDRMKERTYGVWPVGTWQQVAPKRIACVRVTPSYEQPHPSGAPASEVEIVYEMAEPQEAGPAQRTVIEAVQAVEGELVAQTVTESAQANTPPMTDIEAVRRIAFVFAMAERERKKKNEPEK